MPDDEIFCACCFESNEQLPPSLISIRHGTCPWCGSKNQQLYAMSDLAERFRDLINLYSIAQSFDDEPNQLLSEQIQEDWELFSEKLRSTDRLNTFIRLFCWAGCDPRDYLFSTGANELVKAIDYETAYCFRDSLAYYLGGKISEGFIDSVPPPLDWFLSCVKEAFIDIPVSLPMYRAQIWDKNIEKTRFLCERMKAVPISMAHSGRSNREGQRRLYCSSDISTCIAEVRPFKGSGVAVSQIKLQRPARIINFFDPIFIPLPLRVDNIGWRVQMRNIFQHIEYLFSVPANNNHTDLYYKPTQALCDILHTSGYDGIKHRSSLGAGANFVFFDPDIGIPEEPEYFWISDIKLSYSDTEPLDLEYPKHPYAFTRRGVHP